MPTFHTGFHGFFGSVFGSVRVMPVSAHTPSRFGPIHCGQSSATASEEQSASVASAKEAARVMKRFRQRRARVGSAFEMIPRTCGAAYNSALAVGSRRGYRDRHENH